MSDSLSTKFENALIELIERYVDDGLTNADIRGVLDARRDDDHEYRDAPARETILGDTSWCGHGMMWKLCPQCRDKV